jgi:hypothetical protein
MTESLGRREIGRAGLLVPLDRVVHRLRGKHIDVTITVHVRRGYRLGAGGVIRDDVRGEARRGLTVALIPRNGVAAKRTRGQGVHVSVAIDVDREDRFGAVCLRTDDMHGKDWRGGSVVLTPGHGSVDVRGQEDVCIAIAVDIRGGDRFGADLKGVDGASRKDGWDLAAVLIPRDRILDGVVAFDARDHVDVPVAVNVGDADGLDVGRQFSDGVLREGRELAAIILEPRAGADDIGVTIAVEVCCRNGPHSVPSVGDDVSGEDRRLPTVVDVPRDRGVVWGCRENIGVAVAVHVRREDSRGAKRPVGDDVGRKTRRRSTIILIPRDRIVP